MSSRILRMIVCRRQRPQFTFTRVPDLASPRPGFRAYPKASRNGRVCLRPTPGAASQRRLHFLPSPSFGLDDWLQHPELHTVEGNTVTLSVRSWLFNPSPPEIVLAVFLHSTTPALDRIPFLLLTIPFSRHSFGRSLPSLFSDFAVASTGGSLQSFFDRKLRLRRVLCWRGHFRPSPTSTP